MAATDEGERVAALDGPSRNTDHGAETARVARRAGDEALKEAARAGVAERYAQIEDRSVYGCVDWYLYPQERRAEPRPGP
jgi:hypothetical protein